MIANFKGGNKPFRVGVARGEDGASPAAGVGGEGESLSLAGRIGGGAVRGRDIDHRDDFYAGPFQRGVEPFAEDAARTAKENDAQADDPPCIPV